MPIIRIYREIALEVEAVRLGEEDWSAEDTAKWVESHGYDAWHDGGGRVKIYRQTIDEEASEHMTVGRRRCPIAVAVPGEWIVITAGGALATMGDGVFRDTYVEIHD